MANKVVQRMSEPAAEQAVQAKSLNSPTQQNILLYQHLAKPAASRNRYKEETEGKKKEDEDVVQHKPFSIAWLTLRKTSNT